MCIYFLKFFIDNKYQPRKGSNSKFYLDIPPETPAFLCEKIGVDIDVKKMADMTVDDMIQKQNVLYISRGQLKKHTSTVVNISLNIRYISQQVNMPLLRLLHQISNMYQNVKETQMELKEQQPEGKRSTNVIVNDATTKNGSSSSKHIFINHMNKVIHVHVIKNLIFSFQHQIYKNSFSLVAKRWKHHCYVVALLSPTNRKYYQARLCNDHDRRVSRKNYEAPVRA